MLEYGAVLTRPESLLRFGVGREDVAGALDELAEIVAPVAFDFRWRPVAADPDDDLVIETAVNGNADAIASFNLKDLRAGAARFGIAVTRPAALLRRIG